jgi:5S rRNA maturation endonuclease (ribonuclease M5)
MIDSVKVTNELNLVAFGQKGWMYNPKMVCLACGKSGKFGIMFTNKGGVAHCFKCNESQPLSVFLKEIGRPDLSSGVHEYSIKSSLKLINEEKEQEVKTKEVKFPAGLVRLNNDPYLDGRGFLPEHYEQFEPSYTEHFLEKKLHNYIIYTIKQHNEPVAWIARSRYSKEWHEENLKKAKAGEEALKLRYRNSDNTDFTKILGGYDEINTETRCVILVEGLHDKTNTDIVLKLRDRNKVKCLFTFGNKVSADQIELLKKCLGVETIILLFDYNTIKQSKGYGMKLNKYFETFVGLIEDPKLDPGNMNSQQFDNVFKNLKSAIDFYVSNLNTSQKYEK